MLTKEEKEVFRYILNTFSISNWVVHISDFDYKELDDLIRLKLVTIANDHVCRADVPLWNVIAGQTLSF